MNLQADCPRSDSLPPAFRNVKFLEMQAVCAESGETPVSRENRNLASLLYALAKLRRRAHQSSGVAKHVLILRPGTGLCEDTMPQLRSALTKAYDASLAYGNVVVCFGNCSFKS